MSTENLDTPAPKRGSWIKKIAIAAAAFAVLLVITFFVVTSGGFIKSAILPKVGAALNAELTVGDLELSPFSQLVLRDVKLTPKGKETLLTASLVRARYSLFAILGGNLAVEEVTIESPTVTLVQNADGTSNLDPLTQGQGDKKPEAKPAAASGPPPQIDIKTVALKNATVKVTRNLAGGARQTIELANVNVNAANLKNGATGKLDLAAALAFDDSSTNAAANVAAKLNGDFAFDLGADLMPSKLNGKAGLNVDRAAGLFKDLAAFALALDTDVTPTEVKQLAVRFTQASQPLGELRVNGPFDPAKREGKLSVSLLSLDRRVLNIAGATAGIDFGTTQINSTNVIELAKAGAVISAAGQLDVARLQIKREGQTTPTLDLRAGYAVTVDNTAQSAQVRALNLTGTQDGRPLLQTELTSPMTIAWGNANSAVGDATLNVTLTRLNLADWRAFAADLDPAGTASATLKLISQQGGKLLNFDLDANLAGLSAKLDTNSISQMDVGLRARGNGADLKLFKLDEYTVTMAHRGQAMARVSGSGTFDAATQDADLQLALQATVARVLGLLPQSGAEFSGGTVDLTARVTQKAQAQAVAGKLALNGLTGKFGDIKFSGFGTTADLDVGMKGDQLDIRKLNGELHEGANPGGNFGVSGNLDLARMAGQFVVALTNLNQNTLRPFLESALGDKKLVSVALNTTATAKLEANGDAAVKGNVTLANLVVNDPAGKLPSTPLEAKVALDASYVKNVAQIREARLGLTPTERAKNELNLAGSVDLTKSNAIAGNLKLTAESLDVTRYYDLFAGDGKAAPATPPPATKPAEEKEPEAMQLPLSNFAFEASIGKFYLRELEATNIQVVTKIDGGRVLLKPAQLVLNGAPVNLAADLDLGVPGYKYDVNFGASPIPLTPIVNSFMPERKGQVHGVTLANAKIKGAGVTGASLRKNLSGDFSFATTNLDLAIPNLQSKMLKSIINVIVGIPDMIKNPTAALGNLLTKVTGGTTKGGFTEEIMSKPIDSIQLKGRAADGKVMVDQVEVKSLAFEVTSGGNVGLADILTNSTLHFPVRVSLSRPLAEKAGLAGNTPTNQAMAILPDFLTLKGTVGKPETDVKTMVLVGLAAKATGGIAQQTGNAIGGQVGSLINAIGGLAGGNQPTTNAAPGTATNAPANQGVGNLIRGIGGLFGGQKPAGTNPPAGKK